MAQSRPGSLWSVSTVEILPLTPVIGAEVRGVDLGEPLVPADLAAIDRAFLERQLLFFRDQDVSVKQLLDFGRHFGNVSLQPIGPAHPDYPEVMIFELFEPPGAGADSWHVDASYTREPPKATILKAVKLPEVGGDTYFANMAAAYEALSPSFREMIEGLRAVHDISVPMRWAIDKGIRSEEEYEPTRRAFPPVEHPLVRTHPETGRRSLFLATNCTTQIVGLNEQESDLLLGFLLRHIQSPEFHCRLHWEPHSIALWDQRCTVHYAIPDYKEQRTMYRLSVDGDIPV